MCNGSSALCAGPQRWNQPLDIVTKFNQMRASDVQPPFVSRFAGSFEAVELYKVPHNSWM